MGKDAKDPALTVLLPPPLHLLLMMTHTAGDRRLLPI